MRRSQAPSNKLHKIVGRNENVLDSAISSSMVGDEGVCEQPSTTSKCEVKLNTTRHAFAAPNMPVLSYDFADEPTLITKGLLQVSF
jgi:hypothetical protein